MWGLKSSPSGVYEVGWCFSWLAGHFLYRELFHLLYRQICIYNQLLILPQTWRDHVFVKEGTDLSDADPPGFSVLFVSSENQVQGNGSLLAANCPLEVFFTRWFTFKALPHARNRSAWRHWEWTWPCNFLTHHET